MAPKRLAAVMTAVVILAAPAGCGASDTSPAAVPAADSGAVPGATSAAAAPTGDQPTPSRKATAPVPESLRFTSTTVDGKPFDAATLAGKPTVLWFWAAWCPKCRVAAPKLAEVQAEYAGKVNVVGVAGLGSGRDKMAKFVGDTGIGDFPHLADDAGTVWKKFGVAAQEYFVVLDAAGEVVHEGPIARDDLRSRFAALGA